MVSTLHAQMLVGSGTVIGVSVPEPQEPHHSVSTTWKTRMLKEGKVISGPPRTSDRQEQSLHSGRHRTTQTIGET